MRRVRRVLGWAGNIVVVLVFIVLGASLVDNILAPAPEDVVRGYVEALARGDATAALGYAVARPRSTEFVSDEILKQQVAHAPITDITILDVHRERHRAPLVTVSATMGGRASQTTFAVRGRKLDRATVSLDDLLPGSVETTGQALTLFGKPVGKARAYVFPGWVDLGSANPNLTVTWPHGDLLALEDLIDDGGRIHDPVTFGVSAHGRTATMSAIAAALAECGKTHRLSIPGCPQHVASADLKDGTAQWGAPDLSVIDLSLDQDSLTASFSIITGFPLTAENLAGDTESRMVSLVVEGHVDLATSPPTVRLG